MILAPSPIGVELLDDPAADPATVERALVEIARSNYWFGGWWAVRAGLARLLAGVPRGATVTLLDVGTGAGDLPALARGWAARRGVRLVPLGLEASAVAARLARRRGVATALGTAGALPLRDGAVDVALASQVLHHFDAESARRILRELGRVARLGVVVADLRRSPLAGPLFRAGGAALGFHRVTVQDGLLSIRRGYKREELAALAAGAGFAATVTPHPGFRLTATWRTGN